MCRDLTHKIDAVKPDRAETDQFHAKESPLLLFGPFASTWGRARLHRQMTPRLSSMGVGSECGRRIHLRLANDRKRMTPPVRTRC